MTMTPESPTLTPPQIPTGPAEPASVSPSERRSSSRVVAIIAICAGAVLLLGTVTTGILSVVRAAMVHTDTATASVSGLRGIDLDVSRADVTVSYGGVTEPTLTVTGTSGADEWTFERQGDVLTVSSDRKWWGRWAWLREAETAEIVLPLAYEGLDADFEVSGGSLTARGSYGDLDLTLNAGALQATGSADSLTAEVNAGSARIDLDGVTTAALSVNAGSLDGQLRASGEDDRRLSRVTMGVSAGRVDLTVPDDDYALTRDVTAGSFTHNLSIVPTSDQRIGVTVSAGTVVLRAAG